MTLTETLAANGYTHGPAGNGNRVVYCGRKRVFVGTAQETWDWLRMLAVMASA